MRVVALAGGQNRSSISRTLLTAARRLQPPGMELSAFDLEAMPFFDEDLELRGEPLPVRHLKRVIGTADGLWITTGEHNGSVPAVLKNAIDWISRPYLSSSLSGKPCARVAAAYGLDGGRSALRHLREILVKADAAPLPDALSIERVHQRISANGDVLDVETRKQMEALLVELFAAIGGDDARIGEPPRPTRSRRRRVLAARPTLTGVERPA